MAFRCFQSPRPVNRAGKIYFVYMQTNPDTGMSEPVKVDQCDKLPDCEMTDLKALLQAGVSLQQVNSKLLNPTGSVSLPVEPKQETQVKGE